MKRVTIMAHVDPDICRGCRVCEKVCPVYAIHVTNRKAAVEEPDSGGVPTVRTDAHSMRLPCQAGRALHGWCGCEPV